MAEFVEHGLHDQEWSNIVKAVNAQFSMTLSPYDDPIVVLVAVLTSLGVAARTTETLDSLLIKLLSRVS